MQNKTPMTTEKDKAKVYGTKSGKLYIKPFDLFGLKKVQNLITKIANGKQR